MNKIKVLKTMKASENGIEVKEYEAGKEYPMGDALLKIFISNGWGEIISDAPKKVVEEKAVEKAKENKAIETAPENKAVEAAPTKKSAPKKKISKK